MNYKNKFYSILFLVTIIAGLLAMAVVTGCSDDKEDLQAGYGYVQFKLYKSASFKQEGTTRAVDKLDRLDDAKKIKVIMQYKGSTITQTLILNAFNSDNAEFGLRSDKLQLLSGEYTVVGYYLYDKLDELLLTGSMESGNTFMVNTGGVIVQPLAVDAVERGIVTFKLVKDIVKTRAGEETASYPFGNIKVIDITVKNTFTQEVTTFSKIRVNYKEGFKEDSADDELYPGKHAETSYAECDTILWLNAGTYKIAGYRTYSDKYGKTTMEVANVTSSKSFIVSDNVTTENVEVPVRLSEMAEYIKDYIALREIWEALDGKNWKYFGEAAPIGANWNFNKDIDMWGDQPGVSVDSNGRITAISTSGFGARGVVPDAIGQLTELKILSLSTHSELVGGFQQKNYGRNIIDAYKYAIRKDYENLFFARDVREGLSDVLREGINRDNTQKPIMKSNRISLKDVQVGNLTNEIVGISKAMMRLTKLQQFFIANSPITVDGFFRDIKPDSPFYSEKDKLDWANLNQLIDIEIYNCPNLTRLPVKEFISKLPELQALNLSCNKTISGEQLRQDWIDIIAGASGKKIQMMYFGNNNLVEFPEYEHLKQMTKLVFLECTNNQLTTLHPFGKDVNLSKLYLDNNKITKIPSAPDGYFCGYYDVEVFSFTNNQITEVPDVFNAKSSYEIVAVDFSENQITGFENGDAHRGINANTINLSNNRLKEFPSVLFKTGSPVSVLMLAANGLTEIKKGSLEGKKTNFLTSLDMSFNKLTTLPDDFRATTLPYLYGIELSYNCFAKFPTAPLNVDHLRIFAIRHQRDDNGNRILRDWPTGIYLCPSLMALYIGSNDFRKIEDTISPNIRIFEIKDNPNISIDLTGVCPYIQAGLYALVYDKTQDIRGCNVLDLEK